MKFPADDSENDDAHVSETPIEGVEWDLANLPRADLNDVLARYDPISVGTEFGHEYIVVAPRGESALQNLTEPDPNTRVSLADGDQGFRTGIGADSGTMRPHAKVDIARGVGVP